MSGGLVTVFRAALVVASVVTGAVPVASGEWRSVAPGTSLAAAAVVGKSGIDERDRPGGFAPPLADWRPLRSGSPVARLTAVIRFAESHRAGYDAIHGSAKRRPGKLPTAMTVGEVLRWIDATPGQHHAIGLYQLIPATLRRLVRQEGIAMEARFSPELQDRLGRVLMEEAGLSAYLAGRLGLAEFADALALVWAGLPLASGKSAYHGHAGNRATVSRAFVEREIAALRSGPERASGGGWRMVSAGR